MDIFKELLTKTLKNRPVTKVLFLCVIAAYAATSFEVTKYQALSLEWCLYLARGTAIKCILLCSPVALYGSLINSLIEDIYIKLDVAEWLSDFIFYIFRLMTVIVGIAGWLILVSVPALIVSECGIIATGGAFDLNALWVLAMGYDIPTKLTDALLWFSRFFTILFYAYSLIAPMKIKEEPIGKGIVSSVKTPRKEDAA